ncbi:hypothetical protein [Alloyangia pacifica]|uniref:Pilus assembly protein Flp/PilA n=1 Tax=Alloyangia pacifica TaxID=311180 RepID=A0A1I6ST94_9RHOB|nr:hypothetical protein [Alloyangia pacifica]SDG87308.1 pilus assembly protein Flp/PilA [Alloyangia pacifica]SFS80111.1 pilus assembly protein Flp/PilA [Alloyangia pacifica]
MNFAIVSAYCANTFRRLRDEEDGLALTEYLLLLGLLVGGIIAAVGLFGQSLNVGWTGWAEWMEEQTASASTDADGNPIAAGGLAAPE